MSVQKRKEVVIMISSALGTTEIVLVSAVLMIMFGGKKLPELARGLAESVREFRRAVNEPA